jgi:2-polyprenyl-6-methoxyphenol hydroxylase-like FAD-dependent oxidoreductase
MAENPVLVVGAGPTGLVLAIELARRRVPFRLIDRRPAPLGRDRAVVVKSRSLEMLAGMGLVDRFLQRGRVIRTIDLFSGRTKVASVPLDGLDSPFPFDLCIPEEETERILTEELELRGGRIERGVEFAGLEQRRRTVRTRLRVLEGGEESINASWVVGTDGLHSAVRETIGDEFEGHDYPTLWGVVDAHLTGWDRPTNHATVQIEPPVVIAFPLRDGRWRFTFQPEPTADDLLATIEARLAAIAPGVDLRQPDRPELFHTHARVAHRYRIGRVLLAGDAAHASTPFEGHGMNTGMQDAYNLGWKLALVAAGVAPARLLDSYEAERRPIAQAIARSGDDAEARAEQRDPAARQALIQFLANPEGRRMAAIAEAEIAFGYQHSPIVDEVMSVAGPDACGTQIGFRVGDAAPLEGQGRNFRLHELLGTHGHTLLVMLGEADPAAVDRGLALARTAAEPFGPHVRGFAVTRNGRSGAGAPPELLHDPTGALHDRLGPGPCLCVVRPDGHLGCRVEPSAPEALRAHLRRIFRPRA